MIRNLFKRIAEFVTGSSKDNESAAIPFAELSRKKAEEQAKKEREERRQRPRDKKAPEGRRGDAKPQRGDARPQGQERGPQQQPDRRASDERRPQREKRPARNDRPVKEQRPARDLSTPEAPPTEAPQKSVAPRQPRKSTWSLSEFEVPEKEGEVRFHDFDLPVNLMHGIADLGFQYTTPIQAQCLPETLKGRDAIGKAQTGTGKSAAFLITIINHLGKNPMRGGPEKGFPRALILAPTRELALQIEKDARDLCKFTPYTIVSLFGGTGYDKQKKVIAGSVDIIVATPGRLIDFKNQKLVDLSRVEILVIDEADRMLDMGFIPDIRKIVYATPPKEQRQTLFFSATYSSDVMRLAEQWTRTPHNVEIEPESVESASVDQKIYLVTTDEKFPLLYNLLITKKLTKVLVFTNRRDQARRLAEKLTRYQIKTDLLSGEVAQNKRIRALEDFRSGKVEVLVATDVAARGLHIDEISHVINYNLPQEAEHYVHRIGRTGRAGASGISISFACEDDSYYIPAIEELLGHKLLCEYPEDALLRDVRPPSRSTEQPRTEQPRQTRAPKPPKSPSPWHESLPTQEDEDDAESLAYEDPTDDGFWGEEESDDDYSVEEISPNDDTVGPVQDRDEPENDEEAKPAPSRRSRGRRPPRKSRRGNAPKPQAAPSPWHDILTDDDTVDPPVDEDDAREDETPMDEFPADDTRDEPETIDGQNETTPSTVASVRRPAGPRTARNSRRPNAPKYRKRPGNRYGNAPRTDKQG